MSAQQTVAVTGEDKGIRFGQRVVDALLTAIELREPALAAHARHVADLAVQIGRDLLYRDVDLGTLRTAALLHDVGKIALPECIVRKAGPLNRQEQTAMRLHPELGYEIARRTPALAGAAEAIVAHHEYFDGTGYPRGLQKHDIPLDSRIIAVADAFDVITHKRPYKRASTALDAVVEITSCAGTQFDPDVVESLIRTTPVAGLSDRGQHALCA
jgi:putative nucleotidyltransferase with HDIG domain